VANQRRLPDWFRLSLIALVFFGLTLAELPIAAGNASDGSRPYASVTETLPSPQIHSLPPSLARWQSSAQMGDYFSEIRSVEVGYLIWSHFPITVYIEPATHLASDRSQEWTEAVARAVHEWAVYLPLEIVDSSESVDIAIWRRSPSLRIEQDRSPRARSAETRYEIYIDRRVSPAILSHHFTILLRPSQTTAYIQAATRHELGHALGIWGHSPLETDALYFSQVRNPPPISPRDVNTLKHIYEQPTRLGWPV